MQRSARLALAVILPKSYYELPVYTKNLENLAGQIFTNLPRLPGDFTLEMAHGLAYQQTFQHRPGIHALTPLAKHLWKTKIAFDRAVIGTDNGVLSSQAAQTLKEFIQVHADFEKQFMEQAMNLYPEEMFTIQHRSPWIFNHFQNAFKKINPNKEQIEECDPLCIEKIGRLGLLFCLLDLEADITPLFQNKEHAECIAQIRGELNAMTEKGRQIFCDAFSSDSFPPPNVERGNAEIYKKIGDLFYRMDRSVYSGLGGFLFGPSRN